LHLTEIGSIISHKNLNEKPGDIKMKMKTIVGLTVLSIIFCLMGTRVMEAKKKEVYVLSRHIVSPRLIDKVTVKKKKIDKGLRLTMKSREEKKIQVLKGIIEKCLKEAETLTSDANYKYELLYRKEITSTLTDIKNGFQLEMVSDNPELVKIIKKVYIPRQKRASGPDLTEMEGGEIEQDESIR
jgi:hypothetical protein